MYKITKAMSKMRDELVEGGFSDEEAFAMCQNAMAGIISGEVFYPSEEDPTVDVTVSKVGPYAEAEFKLPVKDFDKLIDQVKSI